MGYWLICSLIVAVVMGVDMLRYKALPAKADWPFLVLMVLGGPVTMLMAVAVWFKVRKK